MRKSKLRVESQQKKINKLIFSNLKIKAEQKKILRLQIYKLVKIAEIFFLLLSGALLSHFMQNKSQTLKNQLHDEKIAHQQTIELYRSFIYEKTSLIECIQDDR